MSRSESLFLLAPTALYAVYAAWTLVGLFRPGRPRAGLRAALVGGAVGLHTVFLAVRAVRVSGLPIQTRLDSLALFLWAVAVVFLMSQRPYRLRGIAPVFWPVFAAGAVSAWLTAGREPTAESLDHFWLVLHLVPVYAGYAGFVVAGASAVGYLVQGRLLRGRSGSAAWRKFPSLESLDRIGRSALSLGFPALTVGLAAGAVWAEQASAPLGWAWYADPKVVGGVVVWLFYAAVLHIRLLARVRGRRAALLTVAGLLLTAGSFLAAHVYEVQGGRLQGPTSETRLEGS
ncbi:MAG: cytochrome C assembly family protein [bacterium]